MRTKNWWHPGCSTVGLEPHTVDTALRFARIEGFTHVVFLDTTVYNADIMGRLEPATVAMAKVPPNPIWVEYDELDR